MSKITLTDELKRSIDKLPERKPPMSASRDAVGRLLLGEALDARRAIEKDFLKSARK